MEFTSVKKKINLINGFFRFMIRKTAIALLLIVVAIGQEQFDQFTAQMSRKVKEIANVYASSFSDRCQPRFLECRSKSYDSCSGTSQQKCFTDLPTPRGCSEDGWMLGIEPMTILPTNKNDNTLNDDDKQSVCVLGGIDQKLKQLDVGREKQYIWEYVGERRGFMRLYPSYIRSQCEDYDPRLRPWYVTATTGRKNVIFMIDVSGTMGNGKPSPLQMARDTVPIVIQTLSNTDGFGVIAFSTQARSLVQDSLMRGTDEDKQKVIGEIRGLSARGSTNYLTAFTKAFELLEKASDDEFGPITCPQAQNIFMLLTDGTPDDTQKNQLFFQLDRKAAKFNFNLFTYALQPQFNNQTVNTILQEISCRYNGIRYSISGNGNSQSELRDKMEDYYYFLVQGVTIAQPVWTEPYEDFFGAGRVTSLSYPIYRNNGNFRELLGVAGIDVTMDSLKRFGFNETEVINRLIVNTPCQESSLTQCELENLRPDKCGIRNCEAIARSSSSLCGNQSYGSGIFINPVSKNTDSCCSIEPPPDDEPFPIAAVVVPVVVLLVIIIGIIIWCCKRTPPSESSDNPPANPPAPNPYPQSQVRQHPYPPMNPNPYFNQEGPGSSRNFYPRQ